jgi:hypothetical protein
MLKEYFLIGMLLIGLCLGTYFKYRLDQKHLQTLDEQSLIHKQKVDSLIKLTELNQLKIDSVDNVIKLQNKFIEDKEFERKLIVKKYENYIKNNVLNASAKQSGSTSKILADSLRKARYMQDSSSMGSQ